MNDLIIAIQEMYDDGLTNLEMYVALNAIKRVIFAYEIERIVEQYVISTAMMDTPNMVILDEVMI